MDFLKQSCRFSFLYNGVPFDTLNPTVERNETQTTITTTYSLPDGLMVTNIATYYPEFDAYEWVNFFANRGTQPTGILSRLWDADITLPLEHEEPRKWQAYFPDEKTATKVLAPTGSTWTQKEFYSNPDELMENKRINHIYPGMTKAYAPNGGRSSDGQAPFFNVHKNGKGYIVAVGWSGQWNAAFTRNEDDIRVQTGIEEVAFRLLPGESFRTSSIVIMPYVGDLVDSQNKWRRLVKKHFSLIGKEGRDQFGPFCAGIWGGMKTGSVLERVNTITENDLPFEYIWMDAGWYGIDTKPTPDEFEGDWGQHTGDWRVSPLVHPQGLKDVTQAIHQSGRKFLLWVEPERVIYSTPTAMAHPEYFLTTDDPNDQNRLLNLGDPAAWNYCYQTLAGLIEEIGIDCYRQDFNFSPLPYWRKHDAGDRKGISEIKHINGLYALWDALLERFPGLIIDNCASGGRRIDIETLRRSMPLWRSDYQCPANFDPEASQCHHLTYNSWMPFSGTGSGRIYDEYRMRSAYDSSMTTNFSFSERESFGETPEKIEWIRKYGEEYLLVRPYFMEDFYPLTKVSDQLDVWCAAQFNRPEEGDGIIQLFRRDESAYETACFKLRGLDPEADYSIMDLDGDFTITLDGETLMEEGFRVTLMEPRTAKILLYRAL